MKEQLISINQVCFILGVIYHLNSLFTAKKPSVIYFVLVEQSFCVVVDNWSIVHLVMSTEVSSGHIH